MPNTKSAKKAMRSSIRKNVFNTARKWKIKNSLKELRKVMVSNVTEYQSSLSKVFSQLDKAVKSNLIHKNKANRKKSRLALMVAKALKVEK
jgi:small subunit ribosomal protein S20